ncbi:hypothetical protein MTP99_009458 [Tenebrio molitor]|nr:hypothetical protein MTP99_009458 [Tenebrio molitor]
MSQKIDWAKFADEQEKVLRQKVPTLEVIQHGLFEYILRFWNLQISQINIPSNAKPTGKILKTLLNSFSVAEATLLRKVLRKGLMDSKNDIKVQRDNPNSPLRVYSVKTFEALHL